MTEFDEPDEDSLDVDVDYDHDILLVAGSRPEVARLAPVARAFESVGRIRAITVATGCDPMAVHEAYEALGVPADVTVHSARAARPEPGGRRGGAAHPARRPARRPRPVGDHGARRRDDRGRGRAGGVLAADPRGPRAGRGGHGRPALPVPAGGEPARHRPAGLAVPHHRRCGARQPDRAELDPRRRHDGREPRASRPALRRARPPGADAGDAAGAGGPGPSRLPRRSREPAGAAGPRAGHRGRRVRPARCARRRAPAGAARAGGRGPYGAGVGAARADHGEHASSSPTTRSWSTDAPGLGTPAVLVDGPHIPQPGDSIRSILSPAVWTRCGRCWPSARARSRRRRTGWRRCGSSRRWRGCSG